MSTRFYWAGFATFLTVLLFSSNTTAALIDDFEMTRVPAIATQVGTAPGPFIATNITATTTNHFLRLVNDGVVNQNNRYSYDVTDTGAWENVTAEFDFRMSSPADNAADGVGLVLLSTALWGTNGNPNVGFVNERPNVAGSLAMGIIAHAVPDANDFSLHWDGVELLNQRVPFSVIDIDDGFFHRAILEVELSGSGAYARGYVITNSLENPGARTIVFESFVPGWQPYENRALFAGRTGGLDMDADIDNVSIVYENFHGTPIASVSTNRVFVDFDRAGGTSLETRQFNASVGAGAVIYRPGPIPVNEGGSRMNYLNLIQDGVGFHRNGLTLDHGGPSLASSIRYSFDFRATSASTAADGWGFLMLPTKDFGYSGNAPDIEIFEEPNRPGTLAFGFDMHPEANGTNDVSVHWNDAEIGFQRLDPVTEFDLNNGLWNRAEMDVQYMVSGAVVNLIIYPDLDTGTSTPVNALSDVFIPGVTNYEHRIQMGARSGGAFHRFDLDNIIGGQGTKFGLDEGTVQNFEGGQTWFETWQREDAALYRTEILADAGSEDGFLRLTAANIGNHRNSLLFDHTAQGSLADTNALTSGTIDFRVLGGNVDDPADGFALMLIPTNTYGTTGPGAYHVAGGIGAEKPNYADVFAVGVDVHREANGANDISVHWNGAELETVRLPDSVIDLDTNVFHRLAFSLDWTSTGAWVNVIMTPDVRNLGGGMPTNIIQRLIPDLMPYDYRVEVAARTGGSTANIDLDNIAVDTLVDDTDMDDLPDAWERMFFDDLTTTDGLPGQDYDLDGLDDRAEFLAGTNPKDPDSRLELRAIPGSSGQLLEWDSVMDKRYRIQRRSDLLTGTWSNLFMGIDATAPLNSMMDNSALTNRWLYRVELESE